jgi:Flp pilus assembly protein TadG
MIEFALASFVLIPLFLGTFQFGYAFYVYNLLVTQTRAAGRYASMKTFKCSNSSKVTAWKTAVANTMRFGNPDGSGTVIEPGLTAAQVDVQIKDSDGNDADSTHMPSYVTVTTVNYTVNAVVTTFNFNNKPFARFPYVGRWAPEE